MPHFIAEVKSGQTLLYSNYVRTANRQEQTVLFQADMGFSFPDNHHVSPRECLYLNVVDGEIS